jgi:hypothetical protein
MSHRMLAAVGLATGATLASLTAISTAGQSPTVAPRSVRAWAAPRTAWGDPDLEGLWPGTAMMGVPLERPLPLGDKLLLSDEEFAARAEQAHRAAEADNDVFIAPAAPADRGGGGTGPPGHWGEHGKPQRQTSLVVDPPNGRIPPMTAEGRQRTAAIPASLYYDNSGGGVFNGPEDLSVYDRCITRGVIGSMVPVGYNAGNQIVQGPGWVAVRNEMIHEARMIPLDGRSHLSATVRQYMGDSRGYWDGTTLVVDTTNFNGKTGVGGNGRAIYHSDALHVTERFTRVDADTIQYQATIDDPKTWTQPFTIAFPLKRDPGYGMFEYACHEGNYGLRNILSAARTADNPGAEGTRQK